MPNPTKFNRARVEAYRLYARIRSEVKALDMDEQQDVLEELSVVCTLKARDIENALIDAESDRLHVVARIIHPSLDARERNPLPEVTPCKRKSPSTKRTCGTR